MTGPVDERSPVIGGAWGPQRIDLGATHGVPDAVRMMACDAMTYLPDDILCKVDRASMAVSLETRVPFLDHRFAELAARVPPRLRIDGGTGKIVLRDLLYSKAPRPLKARSWAPRAASSAMAETMPVRCEVYCWTATKPPALMAPAMKVKAQPRCRLAEAVRWRAVKERA